MRLFISIELPDEIKDSIEKVIGEMKRKLTPVKWVDKKNLHLTLKFLGWVEDEKVESLTGSIEDACGDFGPIKISLAGLGVFPVGKRPRVIWVGIGQGGDRVKDLADVLEERLSGKGIREEERDFSSHLTIGRIKDEIDIEALAGFIKKNEKADLGGFTAKHVSLMKSTLKRNGPVYEEIKKIEL